MNTNTNAFIVPAAILGLGLMLSSGIGAYTFYKVRSLDNTLTVTGSAKTAVRADAVKWIFNVTRKVNESTLQSGYAQLARDLSAVQNFLEANGVSTESVTVSPVFMDEIYRDPNQYQGPREYTLRQMITIESDDVDGVTGLAGRTGELAGKGVLIQTNPPEYYYTKLADLRVSLLADAIEDAKARAEQIATPGGQNVGRLKSASSGVVQVLAPNSIDISDYGQYDTMSVEKEVMVTVRAIFLVN